MEENPTCGYYTLFQNQHLALRKAFLDTIRSTIQIQGVFGPIWLLHVMYL
jgi:hypothetical protein